MFEIAQRAKGRLWIMPAPLDGPLEAQVKGYRTAGADHVVSMLTVDEAASLGLGDEQTQCETAGIAFTQHPIEDFGLPDAAAFDRLIAQINDLLNAGRGVAVHCRAGIGRSGMVTSGVLVAQGLSAALAMEKVALARGVSIPDTVEQGKFVERYAVDFAP